MATAPVKSQPLHNFSLPFLKWGGTGTAKTHHHATAATSNHHHNNHRIRRPLPDHEPDSDSDARPHRLGSRPARTNRYALSPPKHHHHHHSSPLRNNDENDEEEKRHASVAAAEAAEEAVQKPWNLRPRKQVAPVAGGASRSGNGEAMEPGGSVQGEGAAKSMRLRGMMMAGEAQCSSERKEKRKFWIALSREEIEEDIFIMTGSRPSRRPRKRPKNIQKQMDSVFPGLWLVGVTADAYRVPDTPAKR